MAEEKITKEEEKKVEKKPVETKSVKKADAPKTEEVKTAEAKTPVEKTEKKATPVKEKTESKPKKEMAEVNAYSLKISPKACFAICKVIKGKSLDHAVKFLDDVTKKKRAVKMENREVGHRKGKGMAGGRFPFNAAREMIPLIGQLKANCDVNGVENPGISIAIANIAARPRKAGGKRAKRTHIHMEAINRSKIKRRPSKRRRAKK